MIWGPIVVPAVEFGSVLVLSGRCLPFPGETFPTISLSGITLKVSGSLSSNLSHKLVWLQLLSPVLCWDAGREGVGGGGWFGSISFHFLR